MQQTDSFISLLNQLNEIFSITSILIHLRYAFLLCHSLLTLGKGPILKPSSFNGGVIQSCPGIMHYCYLNFVRDIELRLC